MPFVVKKMSEFIQPLPYPEDALLTGADSDGRSEITSGLYRHRVSSERLAEYHTGDKDTYLSYAEEATLSDAIQEGIKAEKAAEHLQAEIETMDKVPSEVIEQLLATFQRIKRGRLAKQKLIESHLRYAAYLARASVGIITPPPGRATSSTSDRYKGKNRRPRKIGTYANITNLRSPYAQLEDRIQAAYVGLIKAASSFKPQQTKHGNEQPSFITYAAWYIQNEIEQSLPYETPGYRLPMNVSLDVRKYERSKAEAEPDFDSTIPLERLEEISQGTQVISIDELRYEAIPEEVEAYSSDDERYVGLEELLPDEEVEDPFEYIQQAMLEAGIDQAIATLSEREAGVVRLRCGLADGKTHTYLNLETTTPSVATGSLAELLCSAGRSPAQTEGTRSVSGGVV